jgi:phosphoglycerate dehydrogenase-like enzyme
VVTSAVTLSPDALDALAALDPRLRITAVSREQRPFLRTGQGDAPDEPARALGAMLAEAEVVFAAFEAPLDLLERAPRLRWFHTFSAGIEQWVQAGFLRDGLLFTNGSGPSAAPIAEYCLMSMLMLAKSAAGYVRFQDQHRWDRSLPGSELRGKTVGIVGVGQIGAETARLAKAFGCRVIGSRRSVDAPRDDADGCDLLLPPSELPRLLAESDFVVLAAPATPATATLINAETLHLMKPSAFLINIARGSLVDEAALADALTNGRLAGAALDVFEPEPLCPESPLWDMPNVLVTPHVSSVSEHFLSRQLELATDNLRRYLCGEPLRNLVTAERGY